VDAAIANAAYANAVITILILVLILVLFLVSLKGVIYMLPYCLAYLAA
jgi:hypothetical protein